MFKGFNRNKKGFTLIELIVVMIIIGILVLLATPRFIRYIEQARYTRIVNDIRTLETVVVPDMVRNNMQFPKGTDENLVCDLAKAAKEDKAYMKDGIIAKGTSKDTEEFKKDLVGRISEVGADDIETGFYKLDYKGYVKPEIRTRLKGQFFINRDGDVVYVDGKEVEGTYKDATEAGGEVDRTGVFRYKSDDPTSPDAGVIVGANVEHEYWDKLKTTIPYNIQMPGINNDYISGIYYDAPQFPNTRMIEGKLVPVIEIGSNAFDRIASDKAQRDNTHILIGQFKIGDNIKIIGDNAFGYCAFRGKFEAPRIERIGAVAFNKSNFKGDLHLPEVKTISGGAFSNSKFDGEFKAPKVTFIGYSSFSSSKFKGEFKAPEVTNIEGFAFSNSEFTGDFISPIVESIGVYAFHSSKFDGDFEAPKVTFIGEKSFIESEFKKEFKAPNVTHIKPDAFKNSKFIGEFEALKLEIINPGVFQHSKFRGEIKIPNITSIGDSTFQNSEFEGELKVPKITYIQSGSFMKSKFTEIDLGDIDSIRFLGTKGYAFFGNIFTDTVANFNFTEDKIKINGIDTEAISGVKKAVMLNGYWDREYGYRRDKEYRPAEYKIIAD